MITYATSAYRYELAATTAAFVGTTGREWLIAFSAMLYKMNEQRYPAIVADMRRRFDDDDYYARMGRFGSVALLSVRSNINVRTVYSEKSCQKNKKKAFPVRM